MQYLKSPLNYVGGKYRLLSQIMPYFPDKIDTFVDLFSGGNVGINVTANRIIFNDINSRVNDIFRYLQHHHADASLVAIHHYIDRYHLSKTNEEGFRQLRADYNQHPRPLMLYTLVAYSYNYQVRFNQRMEYNSSFGRNRSHFSKNMEERLIAFTERLQTLNATFTDGRFDMVNLDQLAGDDLVYCDPPYRITTAYYNERHQWTDKDDLRLFNYLDKLNEKGVRFALSNVLRHKGMINDTLISWSNKYQVHHLNYSYQNASYNTARQRSDEVLITNY